MARRWHNRAFANEAPTLWTTRGHSQVMLDANRREENVQTFALVSRPRYVGFFLSFFQPVRLTDIRG